MLGQPYCSELATNQDKHVDSRPLPIMTETVERIPSYVAGWHFSGAIACGAVGWLGDLDSNQGCPGQSREFYR